MPHSLIEDEFMKFPLVPYSIRILSIAVLSMGLMACQIGKKDSNNTSANKESAAKNDSCNKDLNAVDRKALERTAQMYALFASDSKEIWSTSYRLDKTPIMYVRTANKVDQCAYLINHPKAADLTTATEVETAKDGSMPPVYQLSTIPNTSKISKIPNFDFNHDIAGVPTFVMKYTTEAEDSFSAPVSHDWTLFVAHEGMHNFQSAGGAFKEYDGIQDIENYPLNEGNIALILLEDALFKQALELVLADTDSAGLDVVIRQLISVRESRLKQWSAVGTHDLYQEQTEGTARYIEHSLGSLLKFDTINLKTFINMLPPAPEKNIRENYAFGRFYFTGSVLSHLLDTKNVTDWQGKVEQGKSPYTILASQYTLDDTALASELAQAKAAHSFSAMQEKAKLMAAQAAKEPTDIFGGQ